ncbi:MAG: DUF2946 family protein [Betaproteobacteria bacterium]|nr:DUF2946 family protein [Betaproteobacteria bacterium]
MDETVIRSMAKWPNVPSVHGWLELDRRGRWCIKGAPINHAGFNEFISRNYTCDHEGRWYFQNGPQRVYVRIAYLPYIARAAAGPDGLRLFTHTGGEILAPNHVWIDEQGNLVVGFDGTAGLVSGQDLGEVLPWIRTTRGACLDDEKLSDALNRAQLGTAPGLTLQYGPGLIPVASLRSEDAPAKFRFVADPSPAPGDPDC